MQPLRIQAVVVIAALVGAQCGEVIENKFADRLLVKERRMPEADMDTSLIGKGKAMSLSDRSFKAPVKTPSLYSQGVMGKAKGNVFPGMNRPYKTPQESPSSFAQGYKGTPKVYKSPQVKPSLFSQGIVPKARKSPKPDSIFGRLLKPKYREAGRGYKTVVGMKGRTTATGRIGTVKGRTTATGRIGTVKGTKASTTAKKTSVKKGVFR